MQLVKELRKYDRKTNLTKDPLLEIENILNDLDSQDKQLLMAAGFEESIAQYEGVSAANERFKNSVEIIKTFGSENIFKTSSIKKLATVYGLRFLPTKQYKGHVPKILGTKIKEFTEKIPNGKSLLRESYILAPKNSFKLEPIPKDPLYFVKLTDNRDDEPNLYYLVHQWGGEINPLRKLVNIPFRTWKTTIASWIILFGSFSYLLSKFADNIVAFALPAVGFFFCMMYSLIERKSNRSNWDNRFL